MSVERRDNSWIGSRNSRWACIWRVASSLIVVVLTLFCSAGELEAGSLSIESRLAPAGIELDGSPKDWKGLPTLYLEKSLRVVAVSHDDENLYLMYRFSDRWLARRLLDRGVILWLNGDGKKKNKDERFGIRYGGSEQIRTFFDDQRPSASGDPVPDSYARDRNQRRPPARVSRPGPRPGELSLIEMGFTEGVSEGKADGPAAMSAVNDGTFCYELRVPLAAIGGKFVEHSGSGQRRVALGIQIGGLTKAEKKELEEMRQEARGGSGGKMGGRLGGQGGVSIGVGSGGRGGGRGGMGGGGGGRGGMGGGQGREEGRPSEPKIEWVMVALKTGS